MIHFGTDGWRGIISEEYTFANLKLVAEGIAAYVSACRDGSKGVVIGFDARFLSAQYAKLCAEVLAQRGITVYLADAILPTPALSWQVVDRKAAGGIMITASHNPPEYNGLKYKAPYGGAASPEMIAKIEEQVRRLESGKAVPAASQNASVEYFTPKQSYLSHIQNILDGKLLAGYKDKIVFDVMHGAAVGYPSALAECYQLNLMEIRGEHHPLFGGVNPEPVPANLEALRRAVIESGASFGLATDGDGDRIAAMDRQGRYINAHQIIALLARYLVEKKGWTGAVVESLNMSEFVRKIAQKYSLATQETPVGFKYITELMLEGDVLVGGEEAGGIGIKNYIPERDGLLIGFLLIEAAAAYGKPLGDLIAEMMHETGSYFYGRRDLHLTEKQKKRLLDRINSGLPEILANFKLTKDASADGYKYVFDAGWVIFRVSGTEPIVRVYAETTNEQVLEQILGGAQNYAQEE